MKNNSIFNSITFKILLIIILVVLPLNIVSIVSSIKAINSVINETKLSIDNLSDTYITILTERMNNTDYQLYTIRTDNPNGIELFRQNDSNNYIFAKFKLAGTINSEINIYNGADCYYFYMSEPHHLNQKQDLDRASQCFTHTK